MKRKAAVGRKQMRVGILLLTLAVMGFSTAVAVAATVNGDGTLIGSTGNDTINAQNKTDAVWGLGGSDTITAGKGDDVIDGGGSCGNGMGGSLPPGVYPNPLRGTDYCEHGPHGNCGHDNITVGNGNDTIWGNCGPNNISSANGNDTIYAYGGPNNVGVTGNGNSVIYAYGNGNYSVGNGTNTIYAQYSTGDNINCGNASTTVYTAKGANTVSSSCTVKFVAPQPPPAGSNNPTTAKATAAKTASVNTVAKANTAGLAVNRLA
jgi:hypothetical protein